MVEGWVTLSRTVSQKSNLPCQAWDYTLRRDCCASVPATTICTSIVTRFSRQFVYFYSTVSETEETGTEGRSCLQEKVEEDPSSTSSQTDDSIPAGLVHWKKEAMKEEIDMATLDTGPCKHWLTPKFSELVRGSRLIPECAERMLVGSWRTVVEGEEFASSRSAIERVAAQSRQERDRLAEARHRIIKN